MILSFIWWRTPALSHAPLTQRHCVNNSIFRVSVSCVAPCPLSGGGRSRLAAEDAEGGRHFLTSLQHLSIPAFCLSLAVWVPGSSWHSQQLSPPPPPTPPPWRPCSQSSLSQHSAHFTLKLADPRGWPALNPLCDSDCLSSLWMILLGLPSIDPSCHPSLHPWPPSVAWDPWRGWRFKWFSYATHLPVCPVSWLLMTTLERSIMEIPQTI